MCDCQSVRTTESKKVVLRDWFTSRSGSMTPTSSFTAAIFHLLIIQGVSWAIKITMLKVPTSLAVGEGGWLECEWADEGDYIYSLKWYFGIDEFYRWTPLETPSVKIFPVPHFDVDSQASHGGRVLIHNVTGEAGGSYRCEVSGEAPIFMTSSSNAFMTVADLPDERPRIIDDGRGPYRLQQVIKVNCTSHGAKPAPVLTFYVNNQPVDPSWDSHEMVLVNKTSGLETALKSLEFPLRLTMVQFGSLHVKCVASVPELYFLSSEKILPLDLPHNYSLLLGSEGFELNGSSRETTGHTLIVSVVVLFSILLR